MSSWEQSLIERIFAEKQKEKSEDRDNLLRLTSRRLYGEKIHYALELIQNAEDEDSSSITFIFSKDNVFVINNGRPFDEKDVWRICSVRPGEKKRKIGFFGIGFKSVFNITEKPQVISGRFNFEIENYIYPKAKSSVPENLSEYYSPRRGTIFILRYSASSTPEELIQNFNLIDDKILLFLESLEELKFIDNINNNNWVIKKNLQEDSVISLSDLRTGQVTKWNVFHQVLGVEEQEIVPEGKEGIEETRITIAFPLESATRDVIQKTGVVYCYLPTKRRTDLPFLIQADFLPTIGRENISEHSWNVWLMKELGILAAEAIDKTKDDEQFCTLIYDFIPLSEEIQDSLIRHLFESLFEILKEKQIAKTTRGWVKPTYCAIPSDDRLRNILTETDLKILLGEEVFYLEPESSERVQKVLHKLGARPIGLREVVDFLKKENEIKKKSKEWFLNLYEYLSTVFDTTKRSFYADFPWDWNEETRILFGELDKTKFILTDDAKRVSMKDSAAPDRLICYPERVDLSEVHQLFTEGEIVFLNRYFQESSITRRKEQSAETEEKRRRVKEWFDNIGVKRYFKQTHIIKEVILPKFSTGKYKEYADLKLYKLVDYIRMYWSTIESEIRNKKLSADIIEEIRRSVLLKVFVFRDGKRFDEYEHPEEIYFSRRYGKNEVMETLFEGIVDIHFLSSYYLNREKKELQKKKRGKKRVEHTWRKFFEILGVWSSPRVVKEEKWISISGKNGYEWLKKEYSTTGLHEISGDSYSEDMERLIEHCSKMNNQSNLQKRMRLLWQSLERYWKIYKEKYCKVWYKWFYRTEQVKQYETSSFLEFLRNAKWVPGHDGGFYKPSDLFTDTKLNRLLLGDDVKYVSLKADETFQRDLGVRAQPEIEEIVNHLKTFKEVNPHLRENKIEKMNAIYVFLKDKTDSIVEPENKSSEVKEIREIFNENELLYLPREDKVWWKPVHVFWKDYSKIFETLRGYIEHDGAEIYNIALKEFFLHLGLVEKPLVKECLDALEELKRGNVDLHRGVISKAYSYLNEIVKLGLTEETDWSRDVFLSEKGNYLKPSELYYSDNDEYKEYFGIKLEILWLPSSWSNVKEFLHAAGFRRLSQNTTVIKKFVKLDEIEGDVTLQLIQRLICVENYLQKKNVELHRELQNKGIFKKIKELQAFETPEIVLDYVFKTNNPENIVIKDIKKDAYFSFEENRIYKLNQTNLLSTSVAKELSKLFTPGEEDVFPFLDSLFSAESDEKLNEKLRHFGIRIEEALAEEPYEAVKIIPLAEEVKQEPETKREKKKPKKRLEEVGKKPQLPESEGQARRYDLVNPNEFIFDAIEEHTPYVKTEGEPTLPIRTVKLKEGYTGGAGREYKPRERVSRRDAEEIALEIAMRFEEIEGREPDDRHKQQAIGYDVYSKTGNEEEQFIEVKHFRGDPGTFELTPHEWKKAETEKDKYFVYIVSGLKEGSSPMLEIIQNPIKHLTPDPPVQKKFSSWKNGVVKVVKCQKV
jgi:hypothetical protein